MNADRHRYTQIVIGVAFATLFSYLYLSALICVHLRFILQKNLSTEPRVYEPLLSLFLRCLRPLPFFELE